MRWSCPTGIGESFNDTSQQIKVVVIKLQPHTFGRSFVRTHWFRGWMKFPQLCPNLIVELVNTAGCKFTGCFSNPLCLPLFSQCGDADDLNHQIWFCLVGKISFVCFYPWLLTNKAFQSSFIHLRIRVTQTLTTCFLARRPPRSIDIRMIFGNKHNKTKFSDVGCSPAWQSRLRTRTSSSSSFIF